MALRDIREIGEECLTKKCKEVKEMTDRLRILIGDMIDTMHEAEGVGLAAPQVGILRRIVVIDVSEEGNEPIVLINPEIIEKRGEQTGPEGQKENTGWNKIRTDIYNCAYDCWCGDYRDFPWCFCYFI